MREGEREGRECRTRKRGRRGRREGGGVGEDGRFCEREERGKEKKGRG